VRITHNIFYYTLPSLLLGEGAGEVAPSGCVVALFVKSTFFLFCDIYIPFCANASCEEAVEKNINENGSFIFLKSGITMIVVLTIFFGAISLHILLHGVSSSRVRRLTLLFHVIFAFLFV